MGQWNREEIDQAFKHMLMVIDRYPEEGNWNSWVDLLTEDAEYYDDVFEPRKGREVIREWLNGISLNYPQSEMKHFPCPWYIVDEERGWVVCEFLNTMVDPGDGQLYQQKNYSRYKYAGNNSWSEAEDQYNPAALQKLQKAWMAAKGDNEGNKTIFDQSE